jgi:hypothetical protein
MGALLSFFDKSQASSTMSSITAVKPLLATLHDRKAKVPAPALDPAKSKAAPLFSTNQADAKRDERERGPAQVG